MIFEASSPSTAPSDKTLYQQIFENGSPEDDCKICYVDVDDATKSLSYSQVKNNALIFGAGLKRVFPEFKQGNVFAVFSPFDINFIPIFHGTVAVGGVIATLDHTADSDTVADCLETVKATAIFAHSETADRAKKAAQKAGIKQENIFLIDGGGQEGTDRSIFQNFLNHSDKATPIEYPPNKLAEIPCYLYFTSGTTGKKKAVVFTQLTLGHVIPSTSDQWIPPFFSMLCHGYLHHASILVMAMHLNLKLRCTTYMVKDPSAERIFAAIQKFKVNVLNTHAWLIAIMVKKRISDQYDLSSMKMVFSTGSALGEKMARTFNDQFHVPLVSGYGSTETMGCFDAKSQHTMTGTVGSLKPGFTCKIIDENGKDLSYNETGELCAKGPTIMPGYYNNPEGTAKAFDKDGFFHTGDLFQAKENGEFVFVDRIKDVIKYRHHHIAPQQIEDVVMTHPSVASCAAIGVYMEDANTWYPKAFVELIDGDSKDTNEVHKEILEIVKTNLSPEKQLLGGLCTLKRLPRNSMGKVERRILRQSDILEQWLTANNL